MKHFKCIQRGHSHHLKGRDHLGHKHGHHFGPKHGHHFGHKHGEHGGHKHGHHLDQERGHHFGQKHGHHFGHKHGHHFGHKHGHHFGHKHGHHFGHKHGQHFAHEHGQHIGHKDGHLFGHKHGLKHLEELLSFLKSGCDWSRRDRFERQGNCHRENEEGENREPQENNCENELRETENRQNVGEDTIQQTPRNFRGENLFREFILMGHCGRHSKFFKRMENAGRKCGRGRCFNKMEYEKRSECERMVTDNQAIGEEVTRNETVSDSEQTDQRGQSV